MSLYDDLKKGKSVEELVKEFQEELDKAQTRVKEENESAGLLDAQREVLIKEMVKYIQLLGKKRGFKVNNLDEKALNDIIKHYEDSISFFRATGDGKTYTCRFNTNGELESWLTSTGADLLDSFLKCWSSI